MQSYAAPDDWKGAFERVKPPVVVVAGSDDELVDAPAYERALAPLKAQVTILPGIDHMGLCWRPEAMKAIVAALAG